MLPTAYRPLLTPIHTTKSIVNSCAHTHTHIGSKDSSNRPLFPQWSHHVYPQFLPGSHPNHQTTAATAPSASLVAAAAAAAAAAASGQTNNGAGQANLQLMHHGSNNTITSSSSQTTSSSSSLGLNGNNGNSGLGGPTLNGPPMVPMMGSYNGNSTTNGYPADMINCYTGAQGHHHHQGQQQAQHNLANNNSLTGSGGGFHRGGPRSAVGLNNGLIGHSLGTATTKHGKGLNNGDNHIYHCNGMTGIVFCSGHSTM